MGQPVVVPRHGTFPELIADTGGGMLFEPGDAAQLAETLAHLLRNRDQAQQLGQSGHAAVHDRYHAPRMAESHVQLYARLCKSPNLAASLQ